MQGVIRSYKRVDWSSMAIGGGYSERRGLIGWLAFCAAAIATSCVMSYVAATAQAAFPAAIPVSGGESALKGPAVASDSANSQVVAWVRATDSHVVARRVAGDGSIGATLDLSGEDSKSMSLPIVAVAAPDGTVTVVWTRNSDQHLVAVKIPLGGAPGSVIDISQSSVASSSHSNATAGTDGSIHVVWRNGSNSHAITRTLNPNGTLSATTDVSDIDAETVLWGTAPAVAVDAAGTRYFTYHRNTDCHIMLRSLTAGGVLGAPMDLSQTVDKAVGDTSPAVATAGSNVVVVWHRDGDLFTHADDTVFYSFVSGGTSPGAPTQLSASGDVSMREIAVAGSPDGTFAAVWQSQISGEVFHRAIDATGAPVGTPTQISAAPSDSEASPALSIGPTAGHAAAWTAASDDQVMLTSTVGTYSPPAPIKKPTVSLVKRSVLLRKGVVTLKIKCQASSGVSCKGAARLNSIKGVQYAKRSFVIANGKTAKLKLKLNRKARNALRKRKSLRAKLVTKLNGGATASTALKIKSRR